MREGRRYGGDPAHTTGPDPHLPGRETDRDSVASSRPAAALGFRSLRLGGRGRWIDALTSAAVGHLCLLCVGAGLLLAAKLQFPQLGSGFNPLSIVTAMTVLGLAALGAPLHVGEVEISALPLGALALFGVAFTGAVRLSRLPRPGADDVLGVRRGLRVGACFGLLCGIAAAVFRFRGGPDPVGVESGPALLLGFLWGSLFAVLGGWTATEGSKAELGGRVRAWRTKSQIATESAAFAAVTSALALTLSAAAVLVWILAALASGSVPPGFGVRQGVAAVILLVAFAPNVSVSMLALALGSPVEVGGRISIAGREFGRLVEYSLQRWGPGDPPWYAFGLLLIPALACFLAGWVAHRNAQDRGAVLEVVGLGALMFALAILVLGSLGDASLGAGLLGRRGIARVAPDAPIAAVLACGWAAALGFAGWKLGALLTGRRTAP
jgi:hypothetical protein